MREKKSILERLGIISDDVDPKEYLGEAESKKEPELFSSPKSVVGNSNNSTAAPIDTSKVSVDFEHVNVVEQAYANLPKSSEDIFVVEKLLENYSALPQQQKYQILQSTLKTMGKDLNAFINEAQTRKQTINAELERHVNVVNGECDQIKAEIEEAKARIDSLSQRDLDLKNGLEVSKAECENEWKRLDLIITVLGGQIGGEK